MWERAIPQELSSKEVDFLIDVMEVKRDARLLDIPCGFGRLAIPLARKGFNLTCIDISTQFINDFKRKMGDEQLPIRIIQGDILSLLLPDTFDGAFCMGNSFGYFDYRGMEIFVRKLAASLKPNARFIINSAMIAESILRGIPPEKTYTLGDLTMQINNEYVANGSYMVSCLTYSRNGQSEQHRFKHYVYTIGEINRLLENFNMEIIALYNGFEKSIYHAGDPQVYMICKKRN
jgi:cyclopropane fatty-acyl-phospholipid synthase-like methyltransferase